MSTNGTKILDLKSHTLTLIDHCHNRILDIVRDENLKLDTETLDNLASVDKSCERYANWINEGKYYDEERLRDYYNHFLKVYQDLDELHIRETEAAILSRTGAIVKTEDTTTLYTTVDEDYEENKGCKTAAKIGLIGLAGLLILGSGYAIHGCMDKDIQKELDKDPVEQEYEEETAEETKEETTNDDKVVTIDQVDFYNEDTVVAYAEYLKHITNTDLSVEDITDVLYLYNINEFIDENGDFVNHESLVRFIDKEKNAQMVINGGQLIDVAGDMLLIKDNTRGILVDDDDIERISERFSNDPDFIDVFNSAKVNDEQYNVTEVLDIISDHLNSETDNIRLLSFADMGTELVCELAHDEHLYADEGMHLYTWSWYNFNKNAIEQHTVGFGRSIKFGELWIDGQRIDLDGMGGHICAEELRDHIRIYLENGDYDQENKIVQWLDYFVNVAENSKTNSR